MRRRVKINRRRPAEDAEIIVIPMIDVMMFLLFFFMVASLAMVVQSGIPVNLPKAATGSEHPAQNITITIRADNTIYLNTTLTTLDQLEAGLKALHVGDKDLIIINADQRVSYGIVIATVDAARKTGVTRFAYATEKT